MNIGNCYFNLKEYEKAIESYLKQKEVCLKSGANQKGNYNLGAGQSEFNLAKTYYKTKEFQKSLDLLNQWYSTCEKVNSLGPVESTLIGERQSLIYIAKIHFRQENYEKSIETFEKLEKICTNVESKIRCILGICKSKIKLSLFDGAASTLERGRKIEENNFGLELMRLRLMLNTEKKEMAIEMLKKMLENAKEEKQKKKIQKLLK